MRLDRIDVLIRGGRVVDGTGNPWFYGDVALSNGRISDVTPPNLIPSEDVREVVDAQDMIVCPGFIDIQSHSILPLMRDGRCLSKIMQGVTTEIMGEGSTPVPVGGRITGPLTTDGMVGEEWVARSRKWYRFGDWLDAMVDQGVSPNIGSFLGGGTVREFARGMDMGTPGPKEMALMRRVMAEAMEDGAFGVAYALIYPPDNYTSTDEITSVCEVVHRYGGIYITHIRSEADDLDDALGEAFEIGRRANLPVEIYHLKASGQQNWHKMPDVIRRIDDARASGIDVTADMYPYIGSGTGLSSLLPPWVAAGGDFYGNLSDTGVRRKIREEVMGSATGWETMGRNVGAEGVMPVGFRKPEHQPYVGKRLSEIAAMRDQDWLEAAMELLASEGQRISTIFFSMSEDNVRLQMQQPWIKFSTDAGGLDPAWARERGPTHPRAYGTYPRVLGKYVREEKVISLEEAVRKMTSAVADRLSLRQRGSLRPSYGADVVIFNPNTVCDLATFDDPHHLSRGVRDVWVNGVRVLANGAHTGSTPGVVVRGPGAGRAASP
jgi:N-acyl-D-amino-acid deacylase